MPTLPFLAHFLINFLKNGLLVNGRDYFRGTGGKTRFLRGAQGNQPAPGHVPQSLVDTRRRLQWTAHHERHGQV